MKEYPIDPVAKPRMTRRDKWAKRKCVVEYRSFKDECRRYKLTIPPEGAIVTFILPMPESWPDKKKNLTDLMPHTQKPDVDNLLKGLLDAVFEDDSGVYDIRVRKQWGKRGKIVVE